MTHLTTLARQRVALVAAACLALSFTLVPSRSYAELPTPETLVDYGFRGMAVGLELGLAAGYIATGPTFDGGEWRKLVLGLGVGALAGMTIGAIVAVADVTSHDVPIGYYVLRDAGYGTLIGAAMGAIVGMLLWVDDGHPSDVLKGAAFGTLFGVALGMAYGVVEAEEYRATRPPPGPGIRFGGDMHLSVLPMRSERAPGMMALWSGKF